CFAAWFADAVPPRTHHGRGRRPKKATRTWGSHLWPGLHACYVSRARFSTSPRRERPELDHVSRRGSHPRLRISPGIEPFLVEWSCGDPRLLRACAGGFESRPGRSPEPGDRTL